jgi:hypothetical protein
VSTATVPDDGTAASPAPSRAGAKFISRRRASILLFFAIAAAAGGVLVYTWRAPSLHPGIATIELSGGGQVQYPDIDALRAVVRWDFALIGGYGIALVLGGILAKEILWSPYGRAAAKLALPLAVTAIASDLIENGMLLRATYVDNRGWYDAVSALAILKFCTLAVSAAIVAAALLATAFRLWGNRSHVLRERAGAALDVVPRGPIEDDLEEGASGAHLVSSEGAGAGRWRHGYVVPEFEDELKERKQAKAQDKKVETIGICLSGGGVRSASVALGALTSLRAELKRARYLASVSGGGYTAGALQLGLTAAGTADLLPGWTAVRDPETALTPGTVEEDRFRRHVSYIANSPAQMLVALGVLARIVVLSIVTLFGPAVLLGAIVGRWYQQVPLVAWPKDGLDPTEPVPFPDIRTGTWIDLGVLTGFALVCYAGVVWLGSYPPPPDNQLRRERKERWSDSLMDSSRRVSRGVRNFTLRLARWLRTGLQPVAVGVTALVLLVAALAIGLPATLYGAAWVLHKAGATKVAVGGPIVSVLLAYGTTLIAVGRQKKVRSRVSGLFKKRGSPVASVPSGALQLLLVMLALLVLAAGWLLLFGGVAGVATQVSWWEVAGLAVALAFLGGVLDQTMLSLHPFYRRRLADAFAARRVRSADGHTVAKRFDYAERTVLSDYATRATGDDGTSMPEPVYVAAANLTGEERAPLNAVSFTFTGTWVGGPDVGYVRTKHLEDAVQEQLKRDLTVQAAVATSGAAVASAMGRSGRWFGALLAVTGARLGTWLPNPGHLYRQKQAAEEKDWTMAGLPRVRRLSYLLREVLGIHSIEDRLLQITDGGHYENLGLIELFRRRCTRIYCIDSSGDGPPTAGTLASAVSLAYEELGVVVNLSDSEIWQLVAGSGTALGKAADLADLNGRLSASAVIVAPFRYPPEDVSGVPEDMQQGMLYVGKASLTSTMDYDLLSFAARNSVFPHDSTGDQFFDDGKYCAYTALGREIGTALRIAVKAHDERPASDTDAGDDVSEDDRVLTVPEARAPDDHAERPLADGQKAG